MQQGKIYKIMANQYDICCDNGQVVRATARGRFRKEGITPKVGDECKVIFDCDGSGMISELMPRKNELLRPPVANIDQLLIVFAPCSPQPDLLLVDLLICYARNMGIHVIVCVNKTDLDETRALELSEQYENLSDVKVRRISTVSGMGIEKLREELTGCVSCVAGQSAVGKSSLIQVLAPDHEIKTGELSAKTDRGRHTTRHCELISLHNGGFIVDTPGFSMLQQIQLSPEQFRSLYYEFEPYEGGCRFRGCSHLDEPDCEVKRAVERAEISRERYERYCKLFKVVTENWRKRYD